MNDSYNEAVALIKLVLEPESIEHVLQSGQTAQVSVSGGNSTIQTKHSIDDEGIQCVSFWPDRGVLKITVDGVFKARRDICQP